ncbi:MAG: ABC transporter ATP-binding protein [Chloroflexi bacterium]|nr:ABC transporter ATP-binding protein [Chloroflexota bacterium]MCI0576839.1 ABC transporter ATP-binding protein [Chloroflexota bacterium]MCI0649450.1 ABC transporter ATP-binding protein [Chloroflexota bacterium]MCI0730750.1 ABC transporter ATP-binding protein [Chloroflexota bacterium]
MIEAEGLTKLFDDFTAVRDLSLFVRQGELLALLGPNGAGKTTTVRMLSAILRPTQGTGRINGHDIVREADQVRRLIGLLTEQPGLYTRSSGLEYMIFFGRLYGMSDDEIRQRSLALFERFAMPNTAHRRLGEYSKGMRQKVSLIRAMLHDPAVLLLDEPTSAMDPHSAKLVRNAIMELRDDKRAIILCTHNLNEAEILADRIAIINHGRIVAEGSPAGLKEQLLGRPQLEVQLDRPLNGQMRELEALVSVESVRGHVIRYRADDPQVTNPQLVRLLSGLGFGIVSLYEVTRSLEDVYLSVVTGEITREHNL